MPEFKPYPDESPREALERISENIENEGLPTSDATFRSESYQLGGVVQPPTAPSISSYKKGGKVASKAAKKAGSKAAKKEGSDVLDITRNISEKERYSKKRKGTSELTYKPQIEYYTKSSKKAIKEFDWGKKGKKK